MRNNPFCVVVRITGDGNETQSYPALNETLSRLDLRLRRTAMVPCRSEDIAREIARGWMDGADTVFTVGGMAGDPKRLVAALGLAWHRLTAPAGADAPLVGMQTQTCASSRIWLMQEPPRCTISVPEWEALGHLTPELVSGATA